MLLSFCRALPWSRLPRIGVRSLGLLLIAGCLESLEAKEDAKAPATDDELRINGIFNTALPGTEKRNSLKLIVHPHLGDLTDRDHLRSALGLRYGLTARWEATAEVDAYFTHGLEKGSFFEDAGLASFHLGTKYKLGDALHFGWDTAVGVDWSQATGSPPPDTTDGLRHFAPYVTFSRQLEDHPAWRVFWGVGYDDIAATSTVGNLNENQLSSDYGTLSGGFLFERRRMTYTMELSYATTDPSIDDRRDVYTLRPGIIWVIPERYTFGSKGKWLLGFGLRAGYGADGTDFGANAKLRVNFDFRRLLGSKRKTDVKK